jgi:putative transposase
MYDWRNLTEEQRSQVLAGRKRNMRPWHSPPHFETDGMGNYHLSAACYEHAAILGSTPERLAAFESALIELLTSNCSKLHAWCVLPNHWHALVHIGNLRRLVGEVGRFHGKNSFLWNGEDRKRGRQCWHGCADRRIRSDRHFFATRNYIHHNPVKHGYVDKWEEWPFSSAHGYIEAMGRAEVLKEWVEYPVLDMGVGWDE